MLNKVNFYIKSKRIGPDMLLTHWMQYSKYFGRLLYKRKFHSFGDNSEVRPFVTCVETNKISIGRNVVLRPFSMLFAEGGGSINIDIRDDVLIGSGVHIYVSNHEFRNTDIPICFQGHTSSKKVVIREGAWIGACTIILPGVEVGKNSVIGANSVVTKNVPDNMVYAGNPAKKIRSL